MKLVLYGPDGLLLEEAGLGGLEASPQGVAFAFQPTADWLGDSGYLLPGPYAFEVLVGDRVQLRGTFILEHQPEAVAAVARAYASLGSAASTLEGQLLKARGLDPSYPHTYYVAGLMAEFSGDFSGAINCYREAARLSGGRPIELAGRRVDLVGLEEMAYLQDLALSQKKAGNRLFELLKGPLGPEDGP